jgi:dienelactone hydrolase
MRLPAAKALLAALLATLVAFALVGQAVGQESSREEIWRIPGPAGSKLIATVMRPPGAARQPLVVINHGSPADGSQRARMGPPRFSTLSSWFLARGYVVALPLRRGYGDTGGPWAEAYGQCETPDYYGAGLQAASDIQATIDYMRAQPFVTPDRTIVIGQSAGGWASMALSSRNPAGVSGLVNFAGGRGGHQRLPGGGIGNCTPGALVEAAKKYGATARVPMLWIYAANDSFFEPALAERMAGAYNGAGGRATYRALPPFGRDGHGLAGSSEGVAIWGPLLESFIAGLK